MPTPFIMPKFDMDQETATVVEWLKAEGDPIRVDEPVLVVETDKVAIDVPAPAEGILANILVQAGDIVPVTQVIAYILAEGESAADIEVATLAATGREPQAPPERPAPAPAAQSPTGASPSGPLAVTPVAARMAREFGLDLAQVQASGDRITRADVQRHISGLVAGRRPETVIQPSRVAVPASPAARRLAREKDIDLTSVTGSGPRGRVQAADISTAEGRGDQLSRKERPAARIPLVGKRRTIADRMQHSFQTAPHITLSVEADVSRLEEARSQLNEQVPTTGTGGVTMTALLVYVVARLLPDHSFLNASVIGDEIYQWRDVNIGVATAVDDGLMVPVIRQADTLTIGEVNSRLRELVERARSGQLTLEDVHDGTFTLTNLGMFGVRQFQAIINPPESAILSVGKVFRRPVVTDEADRIEVRPIITLTLAADHRVIDGVVAARFLADVVQAIEEADFPAL